ncbi:hypothetical protein HAX54_002631 [Datura stramonium]|uniref:Uncharacterized protein n=1 Tax=Datura stramonium TaxID=4076 RepID=A0ABS8WRG4_DATST|nr:hypothetical protein [Datura stramonium]
MSKADRVFGSRFELDNGQTLTTYKGLVIITSNVRIKIIPALAVQMVNVTAAFLHSPSGTETFKAINKDMSISEEFEYSNNPSRDTIKRYNNTMSICMEPARYGRLRTGTKLRGTRT